VLLLFVFTIVNVAVLVLRRERVEHEHFHAPLVFPVLGALILVALLVDTALDDASVFVRAAILLAVGVALWVVNRLVAGPPEEVEVGRLRG
jgi:basic amino acid/polyamine antiporter, APA family